VSWHYLPVLEEEFLGDISSDGEPCALLKSTPSVGRCSSDVKWMDAYRASLSGTTCEPSTEDHGEENLTLFLEGSRVRTSVQRVPVKDLPGAVHRFGLRCRASLARFGLALRSRKTVRTFVPKDLAPSSTSLPAWGMSADGGFWELGTSVPPTNSETVFGSLLPTLTASEYGSNMGGGAGRTGKKRPSLRCLLPTLTVKGNYNKRGLSKASGDGLATAIASLPTLRASDAEKSGHLTASAESHGDLRLGGPLSPTWCEWFMGFPLGWTALEPLGTRKFQQWLRSHGIF